jgi:hypothetical protein
VEDKAGTKQVLVILGSPRRKGNSAMKAGEIAENKALMQKAKELGKRLVSK